MLRHRPTTRPGYTLLEVLLASMIAIILLAALYAALDVTLNGMDAGRDQVQSSDLSRAILIARMGNDLAGCLGPLPPKSGGGTSDQAGSSSSSSSSSTTSSSTTSSSTTPSSTTGSSDPGATTPAPDAEDPNAMSTIAANVAFQAGVYGSDKFVTIFVSRVPTALTDIEAAANPDLLLGADVRKVTYYLGAAGGLCRQERLWVTADGVGNVMEPDYSTEEFDVIAPEVADVTFEYLDAGSWLGTWDGTQVSTDGVSLVGPPRAIRVTMVLEFPGSNGQPVQKRVAHVFPVRSAVGLYQPPIDTMTGTTTGGM